MIATLPRILTTVPLTSRGPIDLEAKFEPNLLNTAIYLLGLSQQVSTFAINFQGRLKQAYFRTITQGFTFWDTVSNIAIPRITGNNHCIGPCMNLPN